MSHYCCNASSNHRLAQVMGRLQHMGDTQTGGSIAGAALRAMPMVPNAIIVNVARVERITHDVVTSKWALSLSDSAC
jgi:hypothetical protein